MAITAAAFSATGAVVNAVIPDHLILKDEWVEVSGGRYTRTLTRQIPLSPGSTLELLSVNGKINVEGWDRDELYIFAEKRMEQRSDGLGWLKAKLGLSSAAYAEAEEYFRDLTVTIEQVDDEVHVQTMLPPESTNLNFTVHYNIKVPQRTHLNLATTNGAITISGIEGDVHASSSKGKVKCSSVRGSIWAKTSNGAVTCEKVSGSINVATSNGAINIDYSGSLARDTSILCETTNGSIHLRLESDAAFNFVATTSNGEIASEFDLEDTGGRNSRRRLVGKVNGGGARIEARASKGSIRIARTLGGSHDFNHRR